MAVSMMLSPCRFNAGFSNLFRRCTVLNHPSRRALYGDAILGIDNFIKRRSKAGTQFKNMKEQFLDRIQNYVNSATHNMVFTDDIKNVIYLAEDKDEDIRLMIEMLKKFNSQNKELRFGHFLFGPVVMRLLHVLNRPNEVVELLKEPCLKGFFDQTTSFMIASDLLFRQERYQDVLDVFDIVQERQINSSRFPRNITVLALGACYKMNSSESLEKTLKILKDAKAADAIIIRKGITFASGLALKQKDPYLALEILSLAGQSTYFTVQNLKVLALSEMNRIDDVLLEMKTTLEKDVPESNERGFLYAADTLDVIRATIERSQNKEHALTFQRLEKNLREYNHLSPDSLDDSLCSPVLNLPPSRRDSNRIVGFESNFFQNKAYRSNDYGKQHRVNAFRQRRGLNDLDE